MANTLNLGTDGNWATKKESLLAYNSENNNFKPLPFSFSRDTSATVVNKDGLIETVGSGEPRIDFKDNTKGSLLLEPSRTNLWDDSEGTITMQTPQGSFGVFSITNNFITKSTVDLSNQDRNFSFLVKKSGGGLPTISSSGGSGDLVVYISGVSTEGLNGTLTDLGDDWYLYNYQGNTTSTNTTYRIQNKSGVTIYVTKIQLEQGSYPTSYIPTSGATATRNAEASSKANISNLIGQTEGVAYVEIDWKGNDEESIFSVLHDGTVNNRMDFGYSEVFNSFYFNVRTGGNSQGLMQYASPTIGKYKIAISYKNNDFSLWVNGVKEAVDSSGSVPLTTQYNVGNYIGGGREHSIINSKLYNTALTDQELIVLTS